MNDAAKLGTMPVASLLFRFAVPSMVALAAQALYILADRVVIGHVLGTQGLAALTLSYPTLILLTGCALLPSGAATLLSIRLGEHRRAEACRGLAHGFLLVPMLAVLVTPLGLLGSGPILSLEGTSPALLPAASTYLGILAGGFVFQALSILVIDAYRAAGHPYRSMALAAMGSLLNVILDLYFVVSLGLGVGGAALGTVVAMALTSAVGLLFLYRRHLLTRPGRLDPKLMLLILSIGSAPFLMQWASSIAHLLLSRQMMHFGGELAVAALGVIHSLALLMINPVIALGQGLQPIAGYNLGAHRPDRVRRVLLLAYAWSTALLILGWIVCMLMPGPLFALFTTRPDLLLAGPRAMRLMFLALPLVGFQIISIQYFHAAGRPAQAALLTLCRLLLLLPFLYVFMPGRLGLDGLWLASPVSDTLMAGVTALLMLGTFRRGLTPGPHTR